MYHILTFFFFFFFNDTATTEIYTLSLHDALPIYDARGVVPRLDVHERRDPVLLAVHEQRAREQRSEEHTSELQSPCNLVCRLLLEKKKKKTTISNTSTLSIMTSDKRGAVSLEVTC